MTKRWCSAHTVGVLSCLLAAGQSSIVRAQSTADRCAALRSDFQALQTRTQKELKSIAEQLVASTTGADQAESSARLLAHKEVAPLIEVAAPAEISEVGTRAFMVRHKLENELERFVRMPTKFYFEAYAYLRGRTDQYQAQYEMRSAEIDKEKAALQVRIQQCEVEANPPMLELPRHPDGRPLITDATITRWSDAMFSAQSSGVSPWRAGRMSQQDFASLSNRIKNYRSQANDPDSALLNYYTPDELAALKKRRSDIEQVLQKAG